MTIGRKPVCIAGGKIEIKNPIDAELVFNRALFVQFQLKVLTKKTRSDRQHSLYPRHRLRLHRKMERDGGYDMRQSPDSLTFF
jgi:hypothetical protein